MTDQTTNHEFDRQDENTENENGIHLSPDREAAWQDLQHQFEAQIDELNQTQLELDGLRSRYFELYDNAPVGYVTLSDKGLIEEANLTVSAMLGQPRGVLVNQPLTRFIVNSDQDIYYLKRRELLETGASQAFELRMRKRDGSFFWARLEASGGPVCRLVLSDITRRKQGELVVQVRLKLLEFSATHSLDELLRATLDEAEAMTDSLVGFYHFVEDDQVNLVLQAWSTRTAQVYCKAEGKGAHYPVSQAGVWVDCIQARGPVIHNDYASLTHKKGLPEGHAVLVRELVVPVIRVGKIVAIMGVGNKPQDYSADDVAVASMLADVAWDITGRKFVEMAQRKTEQLLNESQSIARMGGWEYDPVTKKLAWTKGVYRLLELPEDTDLSDRSQFSRFFPVHDKLRLDQAFQRAVNTGEPFDLEMVIFTSSGAKLWVRLECNTQIENGQVLKITGTIRDISETKLAELALQEKERLLSESQSLARVGGWEFDLASRKFSFTREFYNILELHSDFDPNLIREASFSMFHEQDREKVKNAFNRVVSLGEAYDMEVHMVNGQDEQIWVHARGLALWENGRISKVTGTIMDISQLKYAQLQLEHSEEQHRLALEAANDGMWDLDLTKNLAQFSPTYYRMLGYNLGEIPLNVEGWLQLVHPEDRSLVMRSIGDCLEGRIQTSEIEIRIRTKSGDWLWVLSRGKIVGWDSDGRPVRMLGTHMDITERKQAVKAVRDSNRKLKKQIAANLELQAMLKEQATRDDLTGLYNRRFMNDVLPLEIARANR